jgi:hypothetical protein
MYGWQLRGVLIGAGLLLGCFGCAEQHPTWISTLPESKKDICAIGVSGPTYYAEDARMNSRATAMTELARAVEVTVKSQMTMLTSGDTTSSDTVIRETAGFNSEVVLKAAQVREQWVTTGENEQYGPKGTVYTLVCTAITR